MKQFTIIGMYEDNGQVYVTTVQAGDVWEAFSVVAASGLHGLTLVGGFEGMPHVYAPCDESGTTCAVEDYSA